MNDLQTMTQSTNRFYTLRHGQSEANVADNISCSVGQFGDKLTKTGRGNAKRAGQALSDDIHLIIASPFGRTKETAEIVAEVLGMPKEKIIYDDALKERDFGASNGKSNEKYIKWLSSDDFDFDKKFDGGESHLDVKKRVMDFLYEIDQKYKNKTVLIVSHHDPIRFLQIGSKGLDNLEAIKALGEGYKNAQLQELHFAPIPHNEEYVLDYHRPYVDKIS